MPSARPSSGASFRYITATEPVWPVESVRGSDPLGAGSGGFNDLGDCLGIGGGPGKLPCVAGRGGRSVFPTPRCPVGGFPLSPPSQDQLAVPRGGGLRGEGEMVALPANFDLAGESITVWQDVNGMYFIRRVFHLSIHW